MPGRPLGRFFRPMGGPDHRFFDARGYRAARVTVDATRWASERPGSPFVGPNGLPGGSPGLSDDSTPGRGARRALATSQPRPGSLIGLLRRPNGRPSRPVPPRANPTGFRPTHRGSAATQRPAGPPIEVWRRPNGAPSRSPAQARPLEVVRIPRAGSWPSQAMLTRCGVGLQSPQGCIANSGWHMAK